MWETKDILAPVREEGEAEEPQAVVVHRSQRGAGGDGIQHGRVVRVDPVGQPILGGRKRGGVLDG